MRVLKCRKVQRRLKAAHHHCHVNWHNVGTVAAGGPGPGLIQLAYTKTVLSPVRTRVHWTPFPTLEKTNGVHIHLPVQAFHDSSRLLFLRANIFSRRCPDSSPSLCHSASWQWPLSFLWSDCWHSFPAWSEIHSQIPPLYSSNVSWSETLPFATHGILRLNCWNITSSESFSIPSIFNIFFQVFFFYDSKECQDTS